VTPRLRIISVTAVVLIAIYLLFGFFIAPRIVRSQLMKALHERVDAEPSIERVRMNPIKLTLSLEGFQLRDRDGRNVVSFDRLFLGFDPLSPFRRAWTLRELTLDKPSVLFVILEDRTLRLRKLLKPQPPKESPAPADSTEQKPPPIMIRRLTINDGTLAYEDHSRQPQYQKTLIPMDIELTNFTTHREDPNAYSFTASTDTGERLEWHGGFRSRPFSSEGTLRFEGVKATSIDEFLGESMPFILANGTLALDAKYRFDARQVPAEFELTDIATRASEVAMRDRASGEEVIAAEAFTTSGGTLRPLDHRLDLGTATITSPRVLVWMDSTGVMNFQRWAKPRADSTGPPFITEIQHAAITGAEVDYQDRRIEPPAFIHTTNGNVEASGFSTAKRDSTQIKLTCVVGGGGPRSNEPESDAATRSAGTAASDSASAATSAKKTAASQSGSRSAKGGTVSGEGILIPMSAAVDLQIEMSGVAVETIEPYVRVYSKVDVTGGTMSGKGRFQFNMFRPQGPLVRYIGHATSSRFALVDDVERHDLMKWKKLELKKLEYDFKPNRTEIGEIVATEAFLRMVINEDRVSNFQRIAVPEDQKPAAFRKPVVDSSAAPVEPPLTKIDLVRVENGTLDFSDLSLQPNFRAAIQELNGTIAELSSMQTAHAAVDLKGSTGPHAPVTISGTINPLNSRGKTDVKMDLENIELTTFTPYSGKFMGYRIERGKLDLHLGYVIENRQLQGENKILMRQLTLGEKVDSPDATNLPVKFAIALLKDKNGNIDLDLPVKGSLDDPKFSVWGIVWKMLGGLVTKAVTSPFKLFGAIFGGEDEASAPAIRFAYGSAEIDSTEIPKLDAIVKGLVDRPGVNLEIETVGDAMRDSAALFDRELQEMLRAAPAKKQKELDPATVAAATKLAPAGWAAAAYAHSLARAYESAFKKQLAMDSAPKTPKGTEPNPAAIEIEEKRLREMCNQLGARLPSVSQEASALPVDRARNVQAYLLQRDSTLTAERLFIVADKGSYASDSSGVRVGLSLRE
jgi:hypothetical protein